MGDSVFDFDPYAELQRLRPVPPLALSSPDFEPGAALPASAWASGAHPEGRDLSPALQWGPVPAGTRSIALSVFDPDAPTGSGYWHWAVFNLPPTLTSLGQGAGSGPQVGLPDSAVTLPNEARVAAYGGAAPPAGTGVHRYFFVVDALDVDALDIRPDATPAILGFNRHFHTLARGVLVGTATSD